MAAALSWILVLLALLRSGGIDAYSNFRPYSGDLLNYDERFGKPTISRSADFTGGSPSKKLNVPDTFQLSLILVRLHHRLNMHRVSTMLPAFRLPNVRVDLLRRRLQDIRKSSGKEPMHLRGAVGDIEQLRVFLNSMK